MTDFSLSRSNRASRIAAAFALVLLAVMIAAPWWASSSFLHLAGEFAVYLALATVWNLRAGSAGLVSVGQQAYVGLGGNLSFTTALFLGFHPLLAVPLGGVSAVIVILVASVVFRLIAAPSHRVRRRVRNRPARDRDQGAGRQLVARSINLLACADIGHGLPCAGLWLAAVPRRSCAGGHS